jgi:hypothetical protein
MRWIRSVHSLLAAAALAGCTGAPPSAGTAAGDTQAVPPAPPASEFPASHHALVEGTVTSRGGAPLDSVTVVAWRMEGNGSLLQLRTETDAAGRFRLPLQASVGLDPAVRSRVVIRGFAYASRYPRGPGGAVALDSVTVPVTLVPMGQAAPVAHARITLPLP